MAIDQLPDLVLFELFSLLNCEEKIRLKAVCSRLNHLLTYYLTEMQTRLFVYQKVISLKENWGCPNRPTLHGEFIQTSLFLSCLKAGYFKNVKCLYLYDLDVYSRDRSFIESANRNLLLNFLLKLDEFFIDASLFITGLFNTDGSMESFNENKTLFFDLPDLKLLCIKSYLPRRFNVQINSQRLEKLVLWRSFEKLITLSNPERIKSIECSRFTENNFQLDRFPNLEHLSCLDIDDNFDLLKYPKLKKLGICTKKKEFSFSSLITQKEILGRPNPEITFFGFKGLPSVAFKNWTEYNELSFKLEDVKKLKDNFLNFVNPLPCDTEIHLTPAIEADLKSLTRLIRQFNITSVNLSKSPRPELVIKFLREINGVRKLIVKECSYGSEFYDQLSSVPFIIYLGIRHSNFSTMDSFDFLRTIRFLRSVSLIECLSSLSILQKHDISDLIGSKILKFRLHMNWCKGSAKRIVLTADKTVGQSDKQFRVIFTIFTVFFETWKEAALYAKECETELSAK